MRRLVDLCAVWSHKDIPRGSSALKEIWQDRPVASCGMITSGLLGLTLSIALLATAPAIAQQNGKHRVTLQDLISLRVGASGLSLSPDGRTLAYALGEDIWLVSARSGSVPRRLGKGLLPIWSPQNDRLAYYSSRSGTLQLWVFDLKTHRAGQITHLTGGIDPNPWTRMTGYFNDALRFSWSPDGTRLVFASRVAPADESAALAPNHSKGAGSARKPGMPLILTATTPPQWTLSGVFAHGFGPGSWSGGKVSWEPGPLLQDPTAKVNQLHIVDVKTKTVRQLTAGSFEYFEPDWSPNGKKIVCASSEGRSLEGGSPGTTNIYSIDVATGEKDALTTGKGDKFMPSWSPDGRRIAYLGGEHFGIGHAFVIPAQGGAVTVIAPVDRYIQQLQWTQDSNSLVLMYRDGVTDPIARADVATGTIEIVGGQEAAYRISLTGSRSGSIAWQEYGSHTVGIIRLLPSGADTSFVLVDPNPQIQQWELGDQEVIRWRNHRGDNMEGLLLKPIGYQQGRRYPLIVDTYPMQQNSLKDALSGNQAWASRGYAVFWPNARAPHVWMNAFKSEAYSQAAKGPNGWEVTIDDVMSGVDELIRRGIVDPNRMGLYGFSNGGGIVNYLVTETSRFKCAVSVAGAVSDWLRLALLETDSKFPDFEGGVNPWSDPEPYIQLSAVFRLEKVTTPMLLADGDEDDDFLLNTIEMYNGLRRFGKEVTFLRYPGQAHGFTGVALKDFWDRENAFLDKYLKPEIPLQH